MSVFLDYVFLYHEEIKRILNSGNACYHLVQKLLSSCLLSENLKIRIYKTIILPHRITGFSDFVHRPDSK
jgi:hypothetical protein